MDDLVLVQGFVTVEDLFQDVEDLLFGDVVMRGALGFDFVFEVIGAVLEDDEVVAVFVLFNVVEFDDVGGGDFLEELDFVLHDFDGGGGVFGAQDFDSEFLFGLGGVA